MFKFLLAFTVFIFFYSCNKESDQTSKEDPQQEMTEEETDTNLTDAEIFSSSLVQEITGTDDIDLQIFLEEQFYPTASKSNKVTLDRLSSSTYLLSYDDNGVMKNFLIQKFYNPITGEFVFDKKETQTNNNEQ